MLLLLLIERQECEVYPGRLSFSSLAAIKTELPGVQRICGKSTGHWPDVTKTF